MLRKINNKPVFQKTRFKVTNPYTYLTSFIYDVEVVK